MGIIKHAKKKIKDERFDKAYCVFDKDEHSNFHEALDMYVQNKNITAIPSVPCFEYWLLLHYDNISKPFAKTEKYSVGDMAKKELRKYINEYEVGLKNVFEITKDKLQTAIENAKRIEKQLLGIGDNHPNPSTKFHQLIEELRKLGAQPAPPSKFSQTG